MISNDKRVRLFPSFQIPRRRKVRVRVRPAADDFVTAESQHFNSALNGLFRDQYKYNPVRQSKPSVSFASPEKSILQGFITDILKSDEPTEAAWTVHPAMTTPTTTTTTTTTPPMSIEDQETTEIQTTTIPTASKIEETTIAETPFDDLFVKLAKKPQDTGKMKEEKKEKSERKKGVEGEMGQETWESSRKWNQKNVQNTLNFGYVAGKYKTNREKDVNDTLVELSRRVEKLTVNEKEAKRKSDIVESVNETGEEDRGVELLKRQNEEVKNEENFNHPKNHRVKWSEVRYPSAFEQSKPSNWKHDSGKIGGKFGTTSIPGLVTRNEGDTSVKTLSDYVQAIFDTMKSAEEETNTATDTEENMDGEITTVLPPSNTLHLPDRSNEEKLTMKDDDGTTKMTIFEGVDGNEANTDVENATTTISDEATTSSSAENNSATVPPLSTTFKPSSPTLSSNSTESILGKVLRTSTTTKVSHMTEICYRGRCVMTRPSRDDRFR